jgi:hypothetical protein
MKKIIYVAFLIIYTSSPLHAQGVLVNTLNGNDLYPLSQLVKFSFYNNRQNLKLIFSDNSEVSYSLDSIVSLTFQEQVNSLTQKLKESFDVFPNPFSSEINIRINEKINDAYLLRITDQNGVVVFEKISDDIQNGNVKLVVGNAFSPGLYFIQIIGDKWEFKKPIIHI